VLSGALVQLLTSGMTTWRTGESRRGAYERAQFVVDRFGRDLAAIYPHNPPLATPWVFQVDSLLASNADGSGEERVTYATPQNMTRIEVGAPYLQPANPANAAWIEYRVDLPFKPKTAMIEPKITLVAADDHQETCEVIVEVAVDDAIDSSTFTPTQGRFHSGARDQTITPCVDISDLADDADERLAVRIRIEPKTGKQSNARLFEAARDDPLRPVFRLALSPQPSQPVFGLWSGFAPNGSQWVLFTRSGAELHAVGYYVKEGILYRAQTRPGRDVGSELPWIRTPLENGEGVPWAEPVANGIAYFGVELENQYRPSEDPEEAEARRKAALQFHWVEADSVPPYAKLIIAATPLSGATTSTRLTADLGADDTTIPVDSTKPFTEGRAVSQFVKIDNEWIRYDKLAGGRLTGCLRGQRGTLSASHAIGATVIAAETFEVSLPVPAWGYRKR
jgi:hypothetical protein